MQIIRKLISFVALSVLIAGISGMMCIFVVKAIDRDIAIDYKTCRYAGHSQEKCYYFYKDSISRREFMEIVHKYFPELDK